jgi:hypothetical protein
VVAYAAELMRGRAAGVVGGVGVVWAWGGGNLHRPPPCKRHFFFLFLFFF